MSSSLNESTDNAPGRFVTTQWTRVLAARGNSADAQIALSDLCGTYYAPVVAFLRCSGNEEDRARELAHEFFARLLEHGGFNGLERGRARFRSYLLGAVKHFLANLRERERAAKRGGGHEHVSLEPGTDTSPGIDPPDRSRRSPEEEFDRQWAMTLLDRAVRQLAHEHNEPEKKEQFEILKPWLTGDAESLSQADAAARLGMNEGAVKVTIHRLRRRFRELVKLEIAQTVSDPDQVKEELRSLAAALG